MARIGGTGTGLGGRLCGSYGGTVCKGGAGNDVQFAVEYYEYYE